MIKKPVHVGSFLADELDYLGMSAAKFAASIGVPANRISQIIAGKRSMTADTAKRIDRLFGGQGDGGIWMRLQARYELDLAGQDKNLALALKSIEPLSFHSQNREDVR